MVVNDTAGTVIVCCNCGANVVIVRLGVTGVTNTPNLIVGAKVVTVSEATPAIIPNCNFGAKVAVAVARVVGVTTTLLVTEIVGANAVIVSEAAGTSITVGVGRFITPTIPPRR